MIFQIVGTVALESSLRKLALNQNIGADTQRTQLEAFLNNLIATDDLASFDFDAAFRYADNLPLSIGGDGFLALRTDLCGRWWRCRLFR